MILEGRHRGSSEKEELEMNDETLKRVCDACVYEIRQMKLKEIENANKRSNEPPDLPVRPLPNVVKQAISKL